MLLTVFEFGERGGETEGQSDIEEEWGGARER